MAYVAMWVIYIMVPTDFKPDLLVVIKYQKKKSNLIADTGSRYPLFSLQLSNDDYIQNDGLKGLRNHSIIIINIVLGLLQKRW